MSAGHTPGPWVVCVQDDDSRGFAVFAEHQLVNDRIADGAWDDSVACAGLNHDNFEENAQLISAAPELLEALQVAYAESKKGIELLGMPLISQAWHDATGAAIAKAIGETPC